MPAIPKSNRLKELLGNPGKKRLREEMRPTPGLPPCPRFLTKVAKKEYRRVGRELLKLGLLTLVDRAALAAYAVTWDRWRDAEAMLQRKGILLKDEAGKIFTNPYVRIARDALTQMNQFLTAFGMSPASRRGLSPAVPPETTDPFEKFLGGNSN